MNRILSYLVLIAFFAISIVLIAARPAWVSDQNEFLRNFVGSDFLNVLAVILAITLASMANIHLEFNKIEEKHQKEGLSKSRSNLKKNAAWLVGLFCAGVTIVAVKPILCGGETGQGIANMAALFIVLWQVLILVSINRLVFAIPPHIKSVSAASPPSPPTTRGKKQL